MNHHPSDATLIAYGSGSLGVGLSLVVATHLTLCPCCRQRVADAEAIGGALLDELPPAALAPSGLDALMARLDSTPQEPRPTMAAAKAQPAALPPGALALPRPLADHLGAVLTPDRWRFLAPGWRWIEVLPKAVVGDGAVRLLKLAPGLRVPQHGHGGREVSLVLQGGFSDQFNRYAEGDIADLDGDNAHSQRVDDDGPCICLVFTDAPILFDDLLPRLANKVLRF